MNNAAQLITLARWLLEASKSHIKTGDLQTARLRIFQARKAYARAVAIKGAMAPSVQRYAYGAGGSTVYFARVCADTHGAAYFAQSRKQYKHARSAMRAAERMAFKIRCNWL